MPSDIELAIGRYLGGDPLGCAEIVARRLRLTAWDTLLLMAALADLDMTELLVAIREAVLEGILRAVPEDAELVAAFKVTLGLEEPHRDLEPYRNPPAPVLAFWSARRLAHRGDAEASRALMELAMAHTDHIESALARHLVTGGEPAPVPVSEVQRAQLAFQLLMKRIGASSRRDGDFVETLLSAAEPGARLEGAVAQATLAYGEGEQVDLPALLAAHRDGLAAATTEALTQAAFLLVAIAPPSAEAEALLEESLGQLASRGPDGRLVAAAHAIALAATEEPGQAHGGTVAAFIVESGVLAVAEPDSLPLFAQLIERFGGRRGLEAVDDAWSARDDLPPEAYVEAALAACGHPEAGPERSAPRLRRAAERICAGKEAVPRAPHLSGNLMHALSAAGEPELASEVGYRALEAVGFQVGDEVALWFARNSAVGLTRDGHGERALGLVSQCLDETPSDLGRRDAARTELLLLHVQIAYHQGRLEAIIPRLYELRYRATVEEPVDPDRLARSLGDIAKIFEFVGSFGTVQRYLNDMLTRPECRQASPALLEGAAKRLARIRIRAFGGTDAEYAELSGRPEDWEKAEHEETASTLGPMLELTRQKVRAHLDGDPAAVLERREQASSYLDSSPLKDGLLHSAIQQSLAIELAHSGDQEGASRLARSSLQTLSRHAAELAAVSPVEDLREICATLARAAEVAVSLAAGRSPGAADQEMLETFLGLRSLWADLRMVRREAGADAASPQRGGIAAARRNLARLLLDGPTTDTARLGEFFEDVFQARLERDLEEIASIHGRLPTGSAAERLKAAFEASVAELGDSAAFVGYFRIVGRPTGPPALTGKLESEPEEYVAILLHKGSYSAVRLGEVEAIEASVERFQERLRAEALAPPAEPTGNGAVEMLVAPLVDPILERAGEATTIHLMADGDLSDLPWQLLFGSRGLEQHRVRVVQSFLSLGRRRARSVRLDPGAVVIARPDYGDPPARPSYVEGIERFEDLASTAVEGEVVAAACGAEVIGGSDAAPRALLDAAPVGVLHVASHGYLLRGEMSPGDSEQGFDQLGADMFIAREHSLPGPLTSVRLKDPLLHSGIAMSGVNEWLAEEGRGAADTGVVTAEDLSWCQLSDVDCVVLSACSSGRGEGSSTLGSRGMRFAALAAGASWVIASLWPVPDVASAVLMEWLYEGFAAGLAPPDALVAAQGRLREADIASILASATASRLLAAAPETMARRYLEELRRDLHRRAPFAHPYFWCGFVCSC